MSTSQKILTRLQEVVTKTEALKNENFMLKTELEKVKKKLEVTQLNLIEKNFENENLQKQVKIRKLAMFLDTNEKQSIRLYLSKLIKDMNQSINQLSQTTSGKND